MSWTSWSIAAAVWCFFCALLWFKHFWNIRLTDGCPLIAIVGSTAVGMLHELVFALLLLYGMFLPFLAAEGVARDYKSRVHELLMATAIPAWAYTGGRFIATLLVCLALALELFAVTWVVDTLLHLTSAAYPAPNVLALAGLWGLTILPATVLLAGASFALGTLWPQAATAGKLIVLVVWVALDLVGDSHLPVWFTFWNPTSFALPQASMTALLQKLQAHPNLNPAQTQLMALQLQAQLPDLQPWLMPHLGLIVAGLALALLAVLRFRRFEKML